MEEMCSAEYIQSVSQEMYSAHSAATAASSVEAAMRQIDEEGRGILLYMRQEAEESA